jgi:hypothetical protein
VQIMEMKSAAQPLLATARAEGAAAAERLKESGEAMRVELDELLSSLSEKVSDMRSSLATATEEGADAGGNGARKLVKQTRKGIQDLDRRWNKLDGKQKLAIAGGLLAVLAAAAATPTVVRKIRER